MTNYEEQSCKKCGKSLTKRLLQVSEHVFIPESSITYRTTQTGLGFREQKYICTDGHEWAKKWKVAIND